MKHTCPLCNKKFLLKGKYLWHLKLIHGIEALVDDSVQVNLFGGVVSRDLIKSVLEGEQDELKKYKELMELCQESKK